MTFSDSFSVHFLLSLIAHWTTHPHFSMGKNVVLALIPLGLSLILFRLKLLRQTFWLKCLWWLIAVVFLLFLPNAAYVLTDVIHLIALMQTPPTPSLWKIVVWVIPLYGLYMLIGFQAYVLSLLNLGYYLKIEKKAEWVLLTELLINLLVAIGIFLGRFQRLNSWYILTRPATFLDAALENFTSHFFVAVTGVTFVILCLLYYLFKVIDLAVIFAWQQRSKRFP
jgi:uncharacterized membrane protein